MSFQKSYSLIILVSFILTSSVLHAQLTEGNIMFVAYNSDGTDGFAVACLVDIPANTTVYFCDNEWNEMPIGAGGAFNDQNEGELTWESGGSDISAGTVIIFYEISSSSNLAYGVDIGTLSGSTNLSGTNEVLYAFLGTNDVSPSTFLSAFANGGFNSTNGSLVNTGLAAGVSAIELSGNEDVCVYSGSTTCNGTVADCAAMIANGSNWTTQDGSGDQSQDLTFPDFPDDVPVNFGGSALPIELIDFYAEKQEQQDVLLHWTTAVEINNAYFTIERSSDGIYWDPISQMEGALNSQVYVNYRFTDVDVPAGMHYYRLKQTDINGDFSYSENIEIRIGAQTMIHCYPNPAKYFLNVECENAQGLITATKTGGRKIFQSNFDGNEKTKRIDISAWSKGCYTISVQTAQGIQNKLVLIQ